MTASFTVDGVEIGSGRLAVIAGPCVIESRELCLDAARRMEQICREFDFGFIFKASFDKANRTSLDSFRGPGLDEGLEILASVHEATGAPVLTDFHEPAQARPVSQAVQMLQVPAFLSRQTDLLVAAARTGLPVNVKKAQFMAPLDMEQVVNKLSAAGCDRILQTERGASFGYHNLIVDFRSLPQMRSLGHPVCYDITHSMQQPGGLGKQSGATREFAPHLARAAAAVGVDALFLEVHPDPDHALSDAAAQLDYSAARALLHDVRRICDALAA